MTTRNKPEQSIPKVHPENSPLKKVASIKPIGHRWWKDPLESKGAVWQFCSKWHIGYTKHSKDEMGLTAHFLSLGFWQFHWWSS